MPTVVQNDRVGGIDGERRPGVSIPAGVPQASSHKVTAPQVYIETQPDSGIYELEPAIQVKSWYWGIDGADCKAELRATLDTEKLAAGYNIACDGLGAGGKARAALQKLRHVTIPFLRFSTRIPPQNPLRLNHC